MARRKSETADNCLSFPIENKFFKRTNTHESFSKKSGTIIPIVSLTFSTPKKKMIWNFQLQSTQPFTLCHYACKRFFFEFFFKFFRIFSNFFQIFFQNFFIFFDFFFKIFSNFFLNFLNDKMCQNCIENSFGESTELPVVFSLKKENTSIRMTVSRWNFYVSSTRIIWPRKAIMEKKVVDRLGKVYSTD